MSNKNKSKYNLSATEMEIMEFLWDTNKKLSASEILKYFNDNKSKNWKKQTLNPLWVLWSVRGSLLYDLVYNQTSSFTGGARLDEKSYNELKKYLEDDLNKA